MNFEYINNYYKVSADLGVDVLVSNRKGTIAKDMGNYIGVIFHDDKKKNILPCHPTSDVIYLQTKTDLKTLRVKNHKSRQRYLDYLHADSSLTFAEWLGINVKKVKRY